MIEHIISVLSGGSLGIVGHVLSAGINFWQHREARLANEAIQSDQDEQKALAASYAADPVTGRAAAVERIAHPVFALVLFAISMLVITGVLPIASPMQDIGPHAIIFWTSMAMSWLFARVKVPAFFKS